MILLSILHGVLVGLFAIRLMDLGSRIDKLDVVTASLLQSRKHFEALFDSFLDVMEERPGSLEEIAEEVAGMTAQVEALKKLQKQLETL